MTFRTRLALVAAVAVAVAVALASVIVYVVVRGELRGQVDDSLRSRAATFAARIRFDPGTNRPVLDTGPAPSLGGAAGYTQLVPATGAPILQENETVALPVSSRDRAAAAHTQSAFFTDAHVAGEHVRVYTVPALRENYAIQIARPLDEVDHALSRVERLLLLIMGGGVAIAAGLGLLVSRTALAPVRRLTEATEHVAETQDLSRRIDAEGRDELSRLAASFNTMLETLEESVRAQRQLVADASHELRTPLTSLRTNIDVLARDETMAPAERERLLADVSEQLSEMSTLVAELVELARGEQPAGEPEEIRLDLLVTDAVERAQRNSTERSVRGGAAASAPFSACGRRSREPWAICSTTRPSGAPRVGASRCGCRTARSPCATTDRESTSRTSLSSSTASTARRRPGGCRARDSGSPSFARWRNPTAGT